MSLLLKNIGRLVQDADTILSDTDLYIEDKYIKKIGPNLEKSIAAPHKTIDASGNIVIPGLINAHTHLYQCFLRGREDNVTLKPWNEQVIFPFAGRVHQLHWNENDIEAGYYWTLLGCIEMLHCGTTTCINMDLMLDSVFEAWRDLGFRGIGAITAVNRWIPKELDRDLDTRKRDILEFVQKWHRKAEHDNLIQVFMAPSTPFACTEDFLQWQMEQALEYDLGLEIHISETRWEVEQAQKEYGTTPLAYLENMDFFKKPVLAVHCVHLTDEEMDILAKRSIIPVYNPKSNTKLGSGIAPMVKMLHKGIHPAIATDGAASNDTQDMLEEMRSGVLLQKVAYQDPSILDAKAVFRMATEYGAAAAEIDAGTLYEGKLADIAILDVLKAHSQPLHDVIRSIVYTAKSENVVTTIINGKLVMENKQLIPMDETEVIRKAAAVAEEKFGMIKPGQSMAAEF